MRARTIFFCVTVFVFCTVGKVYAEGSHRLGAGLHYWYALEDIDKDNVDDRGYALQFSYQYVTTSLLKIEADLDVLQEGYAGSDSTVFSPQAFLLLGKAVYAGAGVGINYSDGSFADSPFFALRAGVELEVLPAIYVDINANYRFETWDFDAIKEDIDTDTITLGA
ncbi:hypothetical protein, partial [Desulfomarina sp.]